MSTVAMRSFLFGLGFWLGGLLASIVDIYVFAHFEEKWGRGWSLQVTAYVLVALALGSAALFAMGHTQLSQRLLSKLPAARLPGPVLVRGIGVAVLVLVASHLAEQVCGKESLVVPVLFWSLYSVASLAVGAVGQSPRVASVQAHET